MAATKPEDALVHVLWINAGLSCDGDSVALTAAMQPSIEEIVLGALPGLPKVAVHWPLIDFECGPGGMGEPGADTFINPGFRSRNSVRYANKNSACDSTIYPRRF
jgi:hydrogenase small subunit